MDYSDIKFNYIKEEDFLVYIDWLTRFKNPVNNLLRVSEKIITKNCINPKFNTKKAEELSFFNKIELAKFIWLKSLEKLLNIKDFSQNKVKNFLIFEELQTFNTDYLISQIKSLEYEKDNIIENYELLRNELFLPIDELIDYFEKKLIQPKDYLKRLIAKKNSKLSDKDLFYAETEFASKKLLFLVEGITEEKLLPVFAQKYELDFDKTGIKLYAAGGKTHILKYYTDIRKLFKIPVFILLDADGIDIIDDLNNILEKKDEIYRIKQGEIEDILSHKLIIKSINAYYSMEGSICETDLSDNAPMTKILNNLYKIKGFGEFHKAKFAEILQSNINSAEDINPSIKDIFNKVKTKLSCNLKL